MAWLAVNKNGQETISPRRPERDTCYVEWDYVEEVYAEGESTDVCLTIDIPKGTIEAILGRPISWADEPVEIK